MPNEWKKLFHADRFSWKYYCNGAAQKDIDKAIKKPKKSKGIIIKN